jgi:hypothetical protein
MSRRKRVMKSPDQWCKITGIQVMDPDGWRNEGLSWSTRISQWKFMRLTVPSTCCYPASFRFFNRITKLLKKSPH